MKVREALQLAADHLAHNRLAEAETLYRQVLAASPQNAAALAGMGKIGLRSGHVPEAADMLRRAVAANPGNADTAAALAEALHRTGRRAEAETIFRELLAADANCFPAVSRFGALLASLEDFARAEPLLRRAAELAPDSYTEHYRLGMLLCYANKPREAVIVLERAAQLCPDEAQAHMEVGHAFMYAGNLLRGFREMEWRWKLPGPAYPDLPYPRWDGTIIPGKTLLVAGEEGFGDVIQFAGFLPQLADAGMTILLSARARLMRLLRSLRGVRVIDEEQLQHPIDGVDFWLPLLSVPLTRGLTLDPPLATPFLFADPNEIARWRERLGEGFHVGLAWSGNPAYAADAARSIPLPQLAGPLARVPGVRLHSLSITPESQQAIASSGLPVQDHTALQHDFADAAALVSCLDVVISVDTSIAHLAGALARPMWLLLHTAPNARWMLHRRDTPFYPTATLFRQPRTGDWASVVEQVHAALMQAVRARDRA
jgi:tetratricopeptide (TPR) repeat protein